MNEWDVAQAGPQSTHLTHTRQHQSTPRLLCIHLRPTVCQTMYVPQRPPDLHHIEQI
jgi:hypothetical protein